jgi:hypothetical protein
MAVNILNHVSTAAAQDKEVHYTSCCDFHSRLEDDKLLTSKIVFSDEATFHL